MSEKTPNPVLPGGHENTLRYSPSPASTQGPRRASTAKPQVRAVERHPLAEIRQNAASPVLAQCMAQPRQPRGMPAGGQFAETQREKSSAVLSEYGGMGRDERVKALQSELNEALDRVVDPDQWRDYLRSMENFHQYSWGNIWLIVHQRPNATTVAGFRDWQNKHKRTVKKGEKAIWILAPITARVKDGDGNPTDEYKMVGAKPVPVFDISQTEGEPLPEPPVKYQPLEGQAPAGMVDSISSAIAKMGFTLRYDETGDSGGWTDFGNRKVVVSKSASERAQARTLAHEMAHIVLGHDGRTSEYHRGDARPDMEVEAESVAYILSRHFGMDDVGEASFGYITNWAGGDRARIKKTMTAVSAGARKALEALGV